MKKFAAAQSLKAIAGASLVEVMVSLLILAVGLLGVLSLQANGLGSNQRSVFVTEAQLLAQDMADRIMAFGDIRATVSGADAGQFGGTDTETAYAAPADCVVECSAANALLYDQNQWVTLVNNSTLPDGRGVVIWDAAASVYTVRLIWDRDRTGAAITDECGDNACYEIEVQL